MPFLTCGNNRIVTFEIACSVKLNKLLFLITPPIHRVHPGLITTSNLLPCVPGNEDIYCTIAIKISKRRRQAILIVTQSRTVGVNWVGLLTGKLVVVIRGRRGAPGGELTYYKCLYIVASLNIDVVRQAISVKVSENGIRPGKAGVDTLYI